MADSGTREGSTQDKPGLSWSAKKVKKYLRPSVMGYAKGKQ
jgi:hypothetical protein